MKNKVLTVGVIGMGIGKYHADAVVRTEKAALTWICDLDEELLADMKDKFKVANTCTDYREMLKDPDLDCVIIGTPDQLHKKITEEALAAGKHVLCEKPLALTREDIEAIVAAAKKSDKKFMVGQVCRYTPGFVKAKELIDAGEIGELTFVESEYAHDYEKILTGVHSWRQDPLRYGVVGGGCHAVDLLRWIAGNPELVEAFGTHKTFKDITAIDDTHVAIMRFPNDVIGKVFCSISCRRDYTMRSVFYGTKGTIITDNTSPELTLFQMNEEGVSIPTKIPVEVNNHNMFGEFAEFYDIIVNDKPVGTTAMEGANTIAACLAIVDSANSNMPVVPQYFD